MISFDNTEVAFRSKKNGELKKAYWLFKIIASPTFVKFGKWATPLALRLNLPINGIIKKTIFAQFCGGESIEETSAATKRLAQDNIKTILDYSIEGKTAEEDFDRTVAEIIATIEAGKNNSDIPFAVFKVTGICLFSTLEAVNNSTENLSKEVQTQYDKLLKRVDEICAAAFNAKQPLFIDAEETWIQDAIDRIATLMSLKYNKEKAIVYNTAQLYRHDRLAFVKSEIEHAKANNYKYGVKLVRGAYMEKERNRALEMGYPSPIQPDKSSCDHDFNAALRVCVENIDSVSFCAGSHNEQSAQILMNLLDEFSIDKNDPRVYFAQLLGMSDHISFNLSNNDYLVAKYVPYGPIKEVLPYLLRRADENTSVAGQTTRELSLIQNEIQRRKK